MVTFMGRSQITNQKIFLDQSIHQEKSAKNLYQIIISKLLASYSQKLKNIIKYHFLFYWIKFCIFSFVAFNDESCVENH
jgi:hypothetical protein